MNFKDIISNLEILRALEELGFNTPTPIQEKGIPEVLKGSDLRAAAQTGTGKTATFIIPGLCRLSQNPNSKGPRILILVPTRELAMQVAAEAVKLSKHLPQLKTVCLYGGVPYPIQNRQLAKKYDILIATPGRLIDHIQQKRIQLAHIEMLILDEADRMLDMGFIEPVEYIASLTPKTRQTLMFSATFGKKVLKLAEALLKDPVQLSIEHTFKNHEQIEQHLYRSNSLEHKYELLNQVLSDSAVKQAIVFSATKVQTEEIADRLCQDGFKAKALHGDMNQRQRMRTMQLMRDGKIQILIATDVAARGIDVQTITHVVNFDLPNSLDDYIHRIGRTGRAGAKGMAFSFVSHRDHQLRKQIERLIGGQQLSAEDMDSKSFAPKNNKFKGNDKRKARFRPRHQKSRQKDRFY